MGQTLPPRVYPERTKRCGVQGAGWRDYTTSKVNQELKCVFGVNLPLETEVYEVNEMKEQVVK